MATCQELALKLSGLQSRVSHVIDDTGRQDLIKLISEVQTQQERQGCLKHVVRNLDGTVTIWTDNSSLSSPSTTRVRLILTIYDATGHVEWGFEPFPFGSATVQPEPASVTDGQFDSASGYLSLHTGVLITNLPVVSNATGDLYLSTASTITIPSGTRVAGAPVQSNGHVQLVGDTTVDYDFGSAHIWVSIAGILGAPQ